MKHGSLFSGIGGFDLAAEWMGWENVFHCEINPFGQKVLKYYWPNAINYEDITKTDFTVHRGTIDILTGGFPCQPFSNAGNKKGEDDFRYMFPEMLRAVCEIKPWCVVAENVYGITSKKFKYVFETICSSLETEGYTVQPYIIPSSAVGAPHERERVWFVAYSGLPKSSGRNIIEEGQQFTSRRQTRSELTSFGGLQTLTYPNSTGLQNGQLDGSKIQVSNTKRRSTPNNLSKASKCYNVSDPNGIRLERFKEEKERQFSVNRDYWSEFPTQPSICNGNDGVSLGLVDIAFSDWRKESIKGFGNAIVPQVAYQIFKSINELENPQ